MKKRAVPFLSHTLIQLGASVTLMFGVWSLQATPAYGQQCSIRGAGDLTLIIDQTDFIASGAEDVVVTAEENLFGTLLLEEVSRAVAQLIAEDRAGSAAGIGVPTQAKSAALALLTGVEPLTDAELSEVEGLLNGGRPAATDKKRIDELLNRLQQAGVKFNGKDTLGILSRILDAGGKAMGGGRGFFLKLYSEGVGLAINGLQKIDRYPEYQRCRRNGGTHDMCWTFAQGGETAERRYELELLLKRAEEHTRNFFAANLGADACRHLRVLLAAWDRIDVADARCSSPPDNIASSGDLLAVAGGSGVPVRGVFSAAEKEAARYFSNRARFRFLETNGFLSDPNDGIGRGDVEQAIQKLQCP